MALLIIMVIVVLAVVVVVVVVKHQNNMTPLVPLIGYTHTHTHTHIEHPYSSVWVHRQDVVEHKVTKKGLKKFLPLLSFVP